jgi:TPR repeat protein
MTNAFTDNIHADRAVVRQSRRTSRRLIGMLVIIIATATSPLSAAGLVEGASLRHGASAFNLRDDMSARTILRRAELGEPAAQSYLGFMFEIGRGVPQNYTEAAIWYRRAAEQGDNFAQYALGLLYDKGHGVPRDIVEASKWLNLATAAATAAAWEARARIRDAVTTKMTRGEIAQARLRALQWVPSREH